MLRRNARDDQQNKRTEFPATSSGFHTVCFGWGTLATNDFRGCDPRGGDALDPISIVCKVSYVMQTGRGGISAVKLSDNYEKATGDAREIAYYREVFGTEGVANLPVTV